MISQKYLIPNWPAPKNIRAYCTTRLDGFSAGNFASFNLASHVGDDFSAVKQNRALLKKELDCINEPFWLVQNHTKEVQQTEFFNPDVPADACISQTSNHICVVMTADCLPLLVTDQKGQQVAAIHAGWRGLANGVIEKTFSHFENPSECLVWFGPAISKKAFEVGREVYDAFVQHDANHAKTFEKTTEDKWLADIYLLARQRLQTLGVSSIFGGEHCTYHESERFFSYRRDQVTGRMASLIWKI